MPRRKNSKEVTVRMYNVGFGDCFLLTFKDGKSEFKALVDCGVHGQGHSDNEMKDIVEHIAQAVAVEESPYIDLIVCTHRHQDHVSGFSQGRWADVEVGEVWMPWTEHPTDPKARRVRTAQSSLALELQKRLAGSTGLNQISLNLALNSLTNEAAMKTLHRGFANNPQRRFISDEDELFDFEEVMPGLKVHVLGPSKSLKIIQNMDPPVGKGYLNFVDANSVGKIQARPFSEAYQIDTHDHRMHSGEKWWHLNHPIPDEALPNDRELSAAVALEKAVNNTSLMLIFEFGKSFLLFTGDAQWGSWNEVLEDTRRSALLSKVNFYKVGHHGSHNATPKKFVETYVDDSVVAMVSTHKMKAWPRIPKQELMEALEERAHAVARSDRLTTLQSPFSHNKDLYAETVIRS